MVITMELKHVIKRGEKYYFRMLVPKDCVKTIGELEIVQSLKTGEPSSRLTEAKAATSFATRWK